MTGLESWQREHQRQLHEAVNGKLMFQWKHWDIEDQNSTKEGCRHGVPSLGQKLGMFQGAGMEEWGCSSLCHFVCEPSF